MKPKRITKVMPSISNISCMYVMYQKSCLNNNTDDVNNHDFYCEKYRWYSLSDGPISRKSNFRVSYEQIQNVRKMAIKLCFKFHIKLPRMVAEYYCGRMYVVLQLHFAYNMQMTTNAYKHFV